MICELISLSGDHAQLHGLIDSRHTFDKFFEDTRVTGLRKEVGRISGVEVGEHVIDADEVVIACGLWSREECWQLHPGNAEPVSAGTAGALWSARIG